LRSAAFIWSWGTRRCVTDGVSRLRRPFLSDGFFFVTVRLLNERSELSHPDFLSLALAFNPTRQNRNNAAVSGLIGSTCPRIRKRAHLTASRRATAKKRERAADLVARTSVFEVRGFHLVVGTRLACCEPHRARSDGMAVPARSTGRLSAVAGAKCGAMECGPACGTALHSGTRFCLTPQR
jgi:hypothetical protein